MPTYEEMQTADRRLVLLRGLQAAVQYRANAFLLKAYATQFGHAVSSDRIAADVAWLAEAGLVKSVTTSGVLIAELTPRGLDVAAGLAEHPGVAKPQPGF